MKDTIPYFYYDLIAKIAPGILVLAALSQQHIKPPVWEWIISVDQGWKTAVVPLLLLGTAYFLGSVLEALFRITTLYNRVSDAGFECAAREFVSKKKFRDDRSDAENPKLMPELSGSPERKREFRYALWQHLVLKAAAEEAPAFSQAHRFQADSKLYLHSAIPAATLMAVAFFRHFQFPLGQCASSIASVIFLILAGVLILFASNAEYRRWLQVLAYAEHVRRGNPAEESRNAAASATIGK